MTRFKFQQLWNCECVAYLRGRTLGANVDQPVGVVVLGRSLNPEARAQDRIRFGAQRPELLGGSCPCGAKDSFELRDST